jgi:hypothetical protein
MMDLVATRNLTASKMDERPSSFLKTLMRNKVSSNCRLDWCAGRFNLTIMSSYLLSQVLITILPLHKGATFLRILSSLDESVNVIEFQATETY